MGHMIDLVTVVHPEDKREPKFKYTFKAPAYSGISTGDYVIANIKNKETLGKVVSVLENVDENSDTMHYIRSVSTISDQKLKPLSYKLVKVALIDDFEDAEESINSAKEMLSHDNLNNYLASKEYSRPHDVFAKLKSIMENIKLGTTYYAIEQGVNSNGGLSRDHYLFAAEYTYCACEADIKRIEAGNIFFEKPEINGIIEVIMKNVDKTKYIDVKKELKKIL